MTVAPYASQPRPAGGRALEEAIAPGRGEFQRDRERIVHARAFRRLKDKTQVFLFDEGDHYRTRLTHTLEVAQIARAIARALRLDEDLTEAIALAHDLGHPPFGHAGERALAAAMTGHGGFDHNIQSLRVVSFLERRYPQFDGLNLTWDTLSGLLKHNGPLGAAPTAGLPASIAEAIAGDASLLARHASAEAQVAAVADDIAYDAHDIDDGLRAGLLTMDALAELPLLSELLAQIRKDHPSLAPERQRTELVRRAIRTLIEDVIAESRARLRHLAPRSVGDIEAAEQPVVALSRARQEIDTAIKAHLAVSVYQHATVLSVMDRAEGVVAELFTRYRDDPLALPETWRGRRPEDRPRVVADFLAGMTDRYALAEHQRLFGGSGALR